MTRWTPLRIKCAILMKGASLKSVSLKANLCARACSVALKSPFPAGEDAISHFLGIPARELWPNRFNADGSRKNSRLFKYSRKNSRQQCQKRTAA